jgi:hypothetical protein
MKIPEPEWSDGDESECSCEGQSAPPALCGSLSGLFGSPSSSRGAAWDWVSDSEGGGGFDLRYSESRYRD